MIMAAAEKIALEVKWRVENYESWLQKGDDTLYSPQFLAETLSNTRWKLSLSPNWRLAEKYVSLSLQRDAEDDGPKVIDLNYELSFLAINGSPLKSKYCAKKFAPITLSHELNVKQAEILEEKKEVYLPEGMLTVCCKIWHTWNTAVEKGQNSNLRSVIGTKCVNLFATIENFSIGSCAVVNFLPPSKDITLISLDVYLNLHECDSRLHEFVFKRKHVDLKNLCWYTLKLFLWDKNGRIKEFSEIYNLTNRPPDTINQIDSYFSSIYLPKRTLTLQLCVTYYPAIVSETIDSKFNNYENSSCGAADLNILKPSDAKRVHSSISDDITSTVPFIEESQSSDEDVCFDSDRKRCLPLTTLKDDMATLYSDHLLCDTKLQTDTETFPAHRNVLSARSPVFKKMFTTDMKEKAGECINVPDMSSDTVRRMLQFLYTDCTGELDMQSAKDLYFASDKYDIAPLKQCCSSFMNKNLCPSNVCEVLVLADMHHDKDLESAAQEFVLTNDEEVFNSDEWKLFMKNYGGLAAQVMYLKFTQK